MRNHYEAQLEELNNGLIKMGMLCEKSIDLAARILLENNLALKLEVEHTEEAIDRKEREVEQLCLRLLLKQQPVAGDLRSVSAALKMISDMERIGDQSRDIAEIAAEMDDILSVDASTILKKIGQMANSAAVMVTRSIDSYVNNNLEMAHLVRESDAEIDTLFTEIKHKLAVLISQGGEKGEICIDLLMIAKYLERIGDHAVNIAEWVEFSLTGCHMGTPC